MIIRTYIEKALDRLASVVVPGLLAAIAIGALLTQLTQVESVASKVLPIRVWMQPSGSMEPDKQVALGHLQLIRPTTHFETKLATQYFWFGLQVGPVFDSQRQVIDFPSRHAISLACWDVATGVLLGKASRNETVGQLTRSRGGFALAGMPEHPLDNILCKAAFRGPAKVSARAWPIAELRDAQATHKNMASTLEVGMGVLALFMLLTAMVTRRHIYLTFVGWLLLNMRMASLSAGSDWDLFGIAINPSIMIDVRQWTVCLYCLMTVALFSQLFKEELAQIKAGWTLTLLQASALFVAVFPLLLSFEQTLPVVWVCTAFGTAIIGWYLIDIMRKAPSRVASWYATSIAFATVAAVAEVIVAATGNNLLIAGVNHVTAAITSALLASLALAEDMRTDRLKRIEAQINLQTAYMDSPIGLFTVGKGGQLINTNPAFKEKLKGIGPDAPTHVNQIFNLDIVGTVAWLQAAGEHQSIELQTEIANPHTGLKRWFSIKASTVDGSIVEGTLQDITDRVRADEHLQYLVNHDPLTNCLNLRGITNAFEKLGRQPEALAYLDLDKFKLINDLYGHTGGDRVLKQVCDCLQQLLGPDDLLARMGGDEFVVAFSKASLEQASSTCRSIVLAISANHFQVDNQSFTLGVSCGLVSTAGFSKAPLKEVISEADTLCRVAKKSHGERLVVMESGNQFFQQHKEELDLIAALERGETPAGLFLVMQPEISLSTPFESLNFEVLLRLRKADGQILPAGIIISAAEARGKTAIIDRWVVRTTIDWLEANRQSLRNTRFVGVNLSGGSLNDEKFAAELFSLFEQHPVATSMICVEITETVALTDMANMERFIDRLRGIGVKVALDDFGAGYSSFGYLKQLSVDALKLDGSLVRDAARNPSGRAIVEALASLVSSLGMKSIGEFAEDLPTIKVLAAAGVDYAQGYGISRPVLPERILAAKSGADFIEDPEIMNFVRSLQRESAENGSLFSPSAFSQLN